MNLLISWAVLSFSLWAAAKLLPGMKIQGGAVSHFVIAAVYGLLSVLIGWLIFVVIGIGTFGLGFVFAFLTRLVVGAILLKLTDAFSDRLRINSFGTAFLASAIVSAIGIGADYLIHR